MFDNYASLKGHASVIFHLCELSDGLLASAGDDYYINI